MGNCMGYLHIMLSYANVSLYRILNFQSECFCVHLSLISNVFFVFFFSFNVIFYDEWLIQLY